MDEMYLRRRTKKSDLHPEVGSAIFFGGALSLECYLFLRPLALDRNDFKFASALSAIPL
jgi:hypothetical protein